MAQVNFSLSRTDGTNMNVGVDIPDEQVQGIVDALTDLMVAQLVAKTGTPDPAETPETEPEEVDDSDE